MSPHSAASRHLGHPRIHYRLTTSTSDRARDLAQRGAPHGTLVTAAAQSHGRGRQGRTWSAPPNTSILMSLVLRPPSLRPRASGSAGGQLGPPTPGWPDGLMTIAAGIAVRDVVGDHALIKWPNDIVFADHNRLRKVGGILAESRHQEGWAVLGIGLNVAVDLTELEDELRGRAATMGQPASTIEPTLEMLLRALERRLDAEAEVILDRWRDADALLGSQISHPHGSGRAEGIDERGRLIVSGGPQGRTVLDAGEVHLSQ